MEQHSAVETNLHQTIAHIESRLAVMNGCGDCAYENALVLSYRELLAEYGARLGRWLVEIAGDLYGGA